MFDLLLSRNSGTDVAELLVVYEAVNSVAPRESLDETLSMLRNSALEIIGNTGIYIRDRLATMYTKYVCNLAR